MARVLAVSRTTHKRQGAMSPVEFSGASRRHSLKNEPPKPAGKGDAYNKVSNYMNYPNNKVKQDLVQLATHGYDYTQMSRPGHKGSQRTIGKRKI